MKQEDDGAHFFFFFVAYSSLIFFPFIIFFFPPRSLLPLVYGSLFSFFFFFFRFSERSKIDPSLCTEAQPETSTNRPHEKGSGSHLESDLAVIFYHFRRAPLQYLFSTSSSSPRSTASSSFDPRVFLNTFFLLLLGLLIQAAEFVCFL